MNKTIFCWNGADIYVEYSYEGASEGSTDSWGAKYEPDIKESVNIEYIWFKNVDVTALFSPDDLEVIEGEILDKIKSEYAQDTDW